MIQKNNFEIYGSKHNRIFNNAEISRENFPLTKYTVDVIKSGPIGKTALPLFPSAVATDMAIDTAKIGYEMSKKGLPIIFNATVNTTRNALIKTLSLGQDIVNRAGRFVYRGTIETTAWPILRALNSSRLSLVNWASNLPKDVLSAPKSVLNAGVGVGAKALSLPAQLIGTPLSWLGFKGLAGAGEKLSKMGDEKMLQGLDPLKNTWGTAGDLVNIGFDNVIDAGRANLTAWTGAVNENWTGAVNDGASEIANSPKFIIGATRDKIKEILGSMRPKHFKKTQSN